jgi:hypothetical protein
MKLAFTQFVSKKGLFTKTLIIAGLILVSLPSCKHSSGGCDAYQGSSRSNVRSVKKFKHHQAGMIRIDQVANKA